MADTGDFELIAKYKPTDSTTNPSLVAAAARLPQYAHLVAEAVAGAKGTGAAGQALLDAALDRLSVLFGREILKLVPGVVSTEVDARLSFDAAASVARARGLIALYAAAGVPKERVLIKMAATWEGCVAARELEAEGIRTNLTLLFSLVQAAAAAEAGAFLISPFVGRVLDWFKAKHPEKEASYVGAADPGVAAVSEIYAYFKAHGIATVVMGASFRNVGEITALAGCDRLTISPALLEKLAAAGAPVPRALAPGAPGAPAPRTRFAPTEAEFRFALNEDAMATEKLAEGIRGFTADLRKLEDYVRPMLA